jgi:hypothetical protein
VLARWLCIALGNPRVVRPVWVMMHVSFRGQVEVLAMLGAWGSVISIVQAAALEGKALVEVRTSPIASRTPMISIVADMLRPRLTRQVQWTASSVAALLVFAVLLFLMYSLTAHFLTEADATLFNLSLLTSDGYSLRSVRILT